MKMVSPLRLPLLNAVQKPFLKSTPWTFSTSHSAHWMLPSQCGPMVMLSESSFIVRSES